MSGSTRAEAARGKGEEAWLLCERRASHAAASSRGAGGAAAGCSGRGSHAPAFHRTQPGHAPQRCWGNTPLFAQRWQGTHGCSAPNVNAGRRTFRHTPSQWPSGTLHAGACGGGAAHWRSAQSMGHRAWLAAQLGRVSKGRNHGSAASYYSAVPAAAASAAQSARQAWNSYAMAAYTPKLPGWFRSRLPEMPESALLPRAPLPT